MAAPQESGKRSEQSKFKRVLRSPRTYITLGSLLVAGSFVDIQLNYSEIDQDSEKAFPPIHQSSEIEGAYQAITVYYEGKDADQTKLQEAHRILDEEYRQSRKRSDYHRTLHHERATVNLHDPQPNRAAVDLFLGLSGTIFFGSGLLIRDIKSSALQHSEKK